VATSISEYTTWAGLPESILDDIVRDRDTAESQGSVTQGVVDGLVSAGVFRLFTPREYGGYECAPRPVLELTRTLAGLDSSAAWLMMASCNSALLAARMDPTGAQEVFADPSAVVAGSLHRGGYGRSGRRRVPLQRHLAAGERSRPRILVDLQCRRRGMG
jgi:hypothetical protein